MMPAGADPARKGPAGRVWIAPISFSSLSNVPSAQPLAERSGTSTPELATTNPRQQQLSFSTALQDPCRPLALCSLGAVSACPPFPPSPSSAVRSRTTKHMHMHAMYLPAAGDESTMPTLAIVWLQPFQLLTTKFHIVAVAIAFAVPFPRPHCRPTTRVCDPLSDMTPFYQQEPRQAKEIAAVHLHVGTESAGRIARTDHPPGHPHLP